MNIGQITFRLASNSGVKFQSFSGFAVRGLFFDFLKRADESLALRLHSQKALAPYSVTPVEVSRENRSFFIYDRFNGLASVQFKISIFEEALMKAFTQALLSSGSPSVKLVDTGVLVTEISVNQQDFEKILDEAKPVKRFEVFFRTPCYFRKSVPMDSPDQALKAFKSPYRSVPLPDVSLMLRNIARLWKRFSGLNFKYRDYVAWVDRGGVILAGYPKGIRTIRVYEHHKSNKWIMGFIGVVRFSIPSDMFSERFAKFTDALMKFAEYSNVGGSRTAGFGVIKYLPKDQL
jgi:CRISPR-associated endoribonuclease Cas6